MQPDDTGGRRRDDRKIERQQPPSNHGYGSFYAVVTCIAELEFVSTLESPSPLFVASEPDPLHGDRPVQQLHAFGFAGFACAVQGDIARAQITIGSTQLEILQIERTFLENVVKEVRDVQTQIADLQERVTAAKSMLDHIDIRAPVAGTVVGLNAHTVGGVIKAGEVILEIVPAAKRLIVEVQVQPTDISSTAVGMAAELFEGVCTDLPPVKKK
jgi:hypothetical protein